MKGDTMDIGASGIQRESRITTLKSLDLGGMAMLAAVKGQAFKAFDADQDGKVSAQEIAKLGNNDPDKLADKQALVSAFDRNGDGALDTSEFGASRLLDGKNLQTLLGVQDEAGMANWLIARADTDGDGTLSADEYAGVASPTIRSGRTVDGKSVWDPVEDVNVQHFGWTDADKDGQLSAEELATKLKAAPQLIRLADTSQAAGVLSTRGDSDGDGALSADELTAAVKAQNLDPSDVGDLMRSADRDGDAKLSAGELQAAARRHPLLFMRDQISGAPVPPSSGEMLLSRLLHSTMRGLSDQMVSELGGALNRTA
ncbi:EF-hand domain-containing protein [Caulobacter sp. LjRoot300]|uniref:EF-hand domain-containing protein n=1 Tax=Caulobacter sp. LjRoot300 TaxID=3342321 RepID=UPI003ECEDA37